jgi:hypothetical protein
MKASLDVKSRSTRQCPSRRLNASNKAKAWFHRSSFSCPMAIRPSSNPEQLYRPGLI